MKGTDTCGDKTINSRFDVLALQEQESLAVTTRAFVNLLNGIYGSGIYARGNVQGATLGVGVTAIVYNANTLSLLLIGIGVCWACRTVDLGLYNMSLQRMAK